MEMLPIEDPSINQATKRVQNLTALAVVLGGLFVGSLFVDFVQLATGQGFSLLATRNHNVLETSGKTWVGYGDPLVKLQVITDENCSSCDPSEALVWLRRVLPTLEATKVNVSDPAGQALIAHFSLTTLPTFIFSKDILHTSFYSQASSLFAEAEGRYFFDMAKIGLPVGKYLTLPEVADNEIVFGPRDAKVTVIEFSDFQCPYCKTFHQDLMTTLKTYGDQVRFVYKNLPLSFHPQAESAALASLCAREQGKFALYADYLFTKQDEWAKTKDTQKFKDYAWWLRLDGRKFSQCLDQKKYADTVKADKEEATRFAVSATPGTFINSTFLNGAVSALDIRHAIDQELAK